MLHFNVWVDGSYSSRFPNVTSGGVVVLERKGTSEPELVLVRYVKTEQEMFVKAHNSGGELIAALTGIIDACNLANGEDATVNIYYDYRGVRDFLNGVYNARQASSILYVEAVKATLEAHKNVRLTFTKIKAHSGVEYNVLADNIAKGNCPMRYLKYRKPDVII